MLLTIIIFLRIFSNSIANLYQKKAANTTSPIVVNLCSYFIMSILCIIPAFFVDWSIYNIEFWSSVLIAGLLCTIGTIALIEALKIGDLSVLAPINSYKSIIGLFSAFILLKEIPSIKEFICVILIVIGSYFVLDNEKERFSIKIFFRKDILLRFFALFCTGIEASFLKKIIIMSSYKISLILWCFSGFICSLIIYLISKPTKQLKKENNTNCFIIAITLLLMQLSTNYVFSKIQVGSALALFQLSSLISLYFGYKVFKETNIKKKLIGTLIMISSATVLILS
ncbi:MAG: DMT family transporter [Candidatus Gastranaerophilales bacterium]|nr:DMT family transporter [Candidatus Gastranaerophilales bacterium]